MHTSLYKAARRLASLLTQYDEKQSRKRNYNSHRAALYLAAVHSWEVDPASVAEPVKTLGKYFTTNPSDLEDFCLAPVRQLVREIRAGKFD